MPVIVKAKARDNTNDLIRRFKKATTATDVVQQAKDRRFYTKPSQVRAQIKNDLRRGKKRRLSIKRMKNVPVRMLPRQQQQEEI